MSETIFVSSIKESELKDGQMKAVRVKGRPILLVRRGGEVFGVSNFCPHAGCSFVGGVLTGYIVMCPCHGWKFDVRNGQYQEIPQVKLQWYRCKIENGKIYIEIRTLNE
ncbi:MAG: Rieske (2Fe-2S) protein [Candidatus Bathyarchaeia archaeon]|jgi:3-phenylpropionate/trans-cinnamate dioxygenase ferredoxin subunit